MVKDHANDYISIKKLLEICEDVEPGIYISGGGQLFELYVFLFATKDDLLEIEDEIAQCGFIRNPQNDELVKKYSCSFYMFLLQGLHVQSQKTTKPLFFFSLFLRFQGIKLATFGILGHMKLTLSKKTFKNMENILWKKTKIHQHAAFNNNVYCFWFDNLNRFHRVGWLSEENPKQGLGNYCVFGGQRVYAGINNLHQKQ